MTKPISAFRNGEDFEMKSTAGDGEDTGKASPEMATEKSKPGRKGVTAEQVFAAADSIRASRREPTVDAVQRLLGTGSTGTVANHLRTWRAAKDGVMPVPSIPEALAKALKGFAESECADVSKQWQARMQPVLDDNATLTEVVTRRQDEKDRQEAEIAQARGACDALNGRCEQQAEEIRRLRELEAAALAKRIETEVTAAQVRQERDMQLQSLMSLEAELNVALRERDSQARELTETKVELARLEARLDGMFEREAEAQVRPMSPLRRPAAGRRSALVLKRSP